MKRSRVPLLLLACLGAGLASCDAPTEPSAAARRFTELRGAPAWALAPERDSAFAQQVSGYRENSGFYAGGWRVARTPERWLTLWDTVRGTVTPVRAAPAVDFAEEMVVLGAHGATGGGGHNIEIIHVTRQRDTTFVLVRTVAPGRDCATPSAQTSLAGRTSRAFEACSGDM